MQKAILRVGGMTCPSCLTTIQTALSKQNGVDEVNVLFNAGKVKALFDEKATDAQSLASIVSELGYSVEKVTVKEQN
ncbi:heavy-metal-associated domain-containing protein [Bifidobacterium subtile]|jgi:copper chaperone CopZ|uniref:Copper chaperone CopZ n=1 Tax=Bifidobacterium subtile TaxID=77635 RepID=A0A087E8F0_9BIFI|nr:heavy-metal-associated domain-containing protein [Bifidobacterium subtile]KFJ04051.1 MerTP family mercury (Hg2) permease, binding protein MerP [Bifidobacterium subtile]MCI1240532.1 heavy-metal-associated domain-containing protein [Bifidobacterium subtile]MCI1258561.1 heavy-metal-associated domain-containing protein [Bifidobacterium subtile]QOL36897.1 heavy-metal-associated domain-containing protein [Bifidobacterium subtile]